MLRPISLCQTAALYSHGDSVGVTSAEPSFHCHTSDVSSAAEGDALVTGGSNYTIREVIDDGTGMTTIILVAG